VCEALLLAEVNVAIMRERDEYRLVHGRGHSPVTISLSEMAGRTLGPVGAKCTTVTYLFLSTTLLVAYIAKSGGAVQVEFS
jgi:amino acid permease